MTLGITNHSRNTAPITIICMNNDHTGFFQSKLFIVFNLFYLEFKTYLKSGFAMHKLNIIQNDLTCK